MLAVCLTVFLGCLFTGLALCRAPLKASKSTALTKAAEESAGTAGTSGDGRTSLEYVSVSSGGSPQPLQCREARAWFSCLTAALHKGPVWRRDPEVSWEGIYFKETLQGHDLYSQITGDSH